MLSPQTPDLNLAAFLQIQNSHQLDLLASLPPFSSQQVRRRCRPAAVFCLDLGRPQVSLSSSGVLIALINRKRGARILHPVKKREAAD